MPHQRNNIQKILVFIHPIYNVPVVYVTRKYIMLLPYQSPYFSVADLQRPNIGYNQTLMFRLPRPVVFYTSQIVPALN